MSTVRSFFVLRRAKTSFVNTSSLLLVSNDSLPLLNGCKPSSLPGCSRSDELFCVKKSPPLPSLESALLELSLA